MSKSFNKLTQGLLSKHGFAIAADGRDTPEFREAIKSFQTAEGLEVTGTVTEETLSSLRAFDVPLPPPRPAFIAAATMLPHSMGRERYVVGDPGGLVEDGNISIGEQKGIPRTLEEEDGSVVVVPGHGNDEEALTAYRETGQHLGRFSGQSEARRYAFRFNAHVNSLIIPNKVRGPIKNPDPGIFNRARGQDSVPMSRKQFDKRFGDPKRDMGDATTGERMDNIRHKPPFKKGRLPPKLPPGPISAVIKAADFIGGIGRRPIGGGK